MGGTSFAAPHVSAILSLILQQYPGISGDDLIPIFEKYSFPEKPQLVDGKELYQISALPSSLQMKSKVKLWEVHC